MRRIWTVGMLLGASILAGCSTTGPFGREKLALPIGPSYVGGRGMQMFPSSPTLVTNVKEAMEDLGIHGIIQNEDPSGLIILEGQCADARKARVTILTSGKNSTVSAKIGWFGDEPVTRELLYRIGNRHGLLPPPPTMPEETTSEPRRTQPIFSRDAVPDATMLRDHIQSGYMPAPNQ